MGSSENLFVTVSDGYQTGIGELSPATGSNWTAERGEEQLRQFALATQGTPTEAHASKPEGILKKAAGLFVEFASDQPIRLKVEKPKHESRAKNVAEAAVRVLLHEQPQLYFLDIHTVWQAMREAQIDPPAMAALDIALWDLLAKRANMPLYHLFGLAKRQACTSMTIGINQPEVTRERVPDILRRTGAKCLKIKLGSPEGREHDKAHFLAAAEAAKPFNVKLRVDANGGWTVDEAKMMMTWLASQGVDYVEQPLVEGSEADLPLIFENRPLPIFVDESCRFSQDIPKWAHAVDGINLKLMKCGGLTEAVRIVATARAFGLKTMIGCMSESSIAIAAGAAIGSLFDHIDLDSHLNLNPDPAEGAPIVDGAITPTDQPGHGARLKDA